MTKRTITIEADDLDVLVLKAALSGHARALLEADARTPDEAVENAALAERAMNLRYATGLIQYRYTPYPGNGREGTATWEPMERKS